MSRVCIVLFVQSAPPSEAPSSAPSKITNVAMCCKIVSRSRSRNPLIEGDELCSQNVCASSYGSADRDPGAADLLFAPRDVRGIGRLRLGDVR